MRHLVKDNGGQMAVELVVVMPVLLVAMVIAVDAMTFMGECARFDHLAAQTVLAQGASPGAGSYDDAARAANIEAELSGQFSAAGMTVRVEAGGDGAAVWGTTSFTCTMEMRPWPLGRAEFGSVGTLPPPLAHSYTLALEPYTPGGL